MTLKHLYTVPYFGFKAKRLPEQQLLVYQDEVLFMSSNKIRQFVLLLPF